METRVQWDVTPSGSPVGPAACQETKGALGSKPSLYTCKPPVLKARGRVVHDKGSLAKERLAFTRGPENRAEWPVGGACPLTSRHHSIRRARRGDETVVGFFGVSFVDDPRINRQCPWVSKGK
ncbi:hypothetical protein AAFF_G00380710 [Aldrovandia affinis]|uniref:Uncharacterized protein n=1 Tax=Aldrovandia affinis TaxID=143900 RepID=A0AAD7T7X2_9TELE|nr:hypothetical protein AAFF_G00380710 [Aldrovandia affinis]